MRSIYQAYREAYGGLPLEVWILSFALFINRCGSMVLAFLTLYLTSKLGFTITQAGTIFSVFGLGSVVGAYIGGKLIAPFGAVRLQIAGLVLAGPLFFCVPLFTAWWGVAFIVFILAICSESVRPANNVAVSEFTTPKIRTRAYGLQRMAVNLGMSFGPVVGGFLAEIDFVWLFVVDGISTAFGGLFLFYFFGFSRYAKGTATTARQRHSEQNQSKESVWSDPHFFYFLGLLLLTAFVFFQVHATYPKYLEEHYLLSKPQIGMIYGINTVIIVVIEMILVSYVTRFSLLRTIGWGCFLACFGFAILPASVATWFVILSMVIITFGEMLIFPLALSLIHI